MKKSDFLIKTGERFAVMNPSLKLSTNYGLSTDEALVKLKEIIKNEAGSSPKYHKRKLLSLLWKTFHWNQLNSVTWFGLLSLLFVIVGIIAHVSTENTFRYVSMCDHVI